MNNSRRNTWPLVRWRAAVLLAAASCGMNGIAMAEPIKIGMKEFMFSPVTITVPAGSQVTWMNMDDEPHTVVSDTGMFRSGGIDTNETFSFKFDKPGTYHYTCSIHPRMIGTIIVQ
jgi:plastocyanin